jgi:hypothetical protein
LARIGGQSGGDFEAAKRGAGVACGVVDEVGAEPNPQAARHQGGYVEHRLAMGLPPGKHRVSVQAEGAPVRLRQLYAHTVQA